MSGRTLEILKQTLLRDGKNDFSKLKDAFSLCVDSKDIQGAKRVITLSEKFIRDGAGYEGIKLYRNALLFCAPEDFDCFMLYLEHQRPFEQQYWLPRRKILMPICKSLQSLETGDLQELFLSMPPRTGKSTIIMMFLLWVMGRDPERRNLYCSFTKTTVNAFYKGIMEILCDKDTYSYTDIFPKAVIADQNAMDGLINIERKKRYASLTCRPIGGSLNGSCDCNGYSIGDDLCSGIEEAMSKERLYSLWQAVTNNFIPRAIPPAKRIWMGTRWSILDPQGMRLDLIQNDPTYKNVKWEYINIPALNDKDESNFLYDHGRAIPTEYYHQFRASFERVGDMASWFAQFMGEPIERDGAVFNPEDLRFYNGVLPEATPDRIFMAVDPAWGGGDFTAAPVCYQYGDVIYVHDVVFDNGDKRVTIPLLSKAIEKHGVQAAMVEATRTTASYAEELDKNLKENGIRINIQSSISHYTGTGKRQRIFDKAPDIRECMRFLDEGFRSKEYSQFMANVYSFTVTGKSAKHDDAPDSLAMAINMAFLGDREVIVFARPF